jgi:transcriptional regulator with XRE-family HTH domain
VSKPKRTVYAERLILQREIAGMSQGDLAEKTGITKAQVARIELGDVAEPGHDMLKRLAKGLGCSPRELDDPEFYAPEKPWTTMRRLVAENRRMSSQVKRAFLTLLQPWY